jgi:dihydrolipoamide dehydrogenase
VVGIAEATGSAQAVVTASEGTAVKLVADELGQLLGVHAVGEGSGEIVNAAATLLQLEVTVDDVAALRPWHPSWTEILVDAARAATS